MKELINEIFQSSHSIAVIGIKPNIHQIAYKVPAYMKDNSYKIIPINPKFRGQEILGGYVYGSITEVTEMIDVVNIFRKPEYLTMHAQEIISMKSLPRYVWFQLGIRNDEAAQILERSGIKVIQNRCIMVEHIRYTGC